jgi:hypothetical protein
MKLSILQKAVLLGTSLAAVLNGTLTCGGESEKKPDSIALRVAKSSGTLMRISANLEVGGALQTAMNRAGKQPEPVPMSVVAQFSYDELRLDEGADEVHRFSLRGYDQNQAVIKIASKVNKPQLRETRKLISATSTMGDVILASPNGALTRDELELIDIPANTLVLDQVLPTDAVAIGHRWKPTEDVMARFLCLDAVGHTEVECVLVEAKDGVAQVTIDGTLGGAIDGISTEIELKGKLLVDISHADTPTLKSLLLAIKEKRGASYVDPGVDVVAKLRLGLEPIAESKLLPEDAIAAARAGRSSSEANESVGPALEYISTTKGVRFHYDRRWHITREEQDVVVMRLVDRGDLIAQCNIAPTNLAGSDTGDKSADGSATPLALADFQTQVQTALGKLFGQFEKAKQRGTDSGLRILEAVALGSAQDLPIQWRYYMVHDRQGRAATVVFTMEAPKAEQFADQDAPIVDSVEFMEPKTARAAEVKSAVK